MTDWLGDDMRTRMGVAAGTGLVPAEEPEDTPPTGGFDGGTQSPGAPADATLSEAMRTRAFGG